VPIFFHGSEIGLIWRRLYERLWVKSLLGGLKGAISPVFNWEGLNGLPEKFHSLLRLLRDVPIINFLIVLRA
jgi:hypothetical protein